MFCDCSSCCRYKWMLVEYSTTSGFCLSGLLFRNYSRFLQAPKRETLGAIWAGFYRPDILVTQSIVLKHWFIEAVAHRTSSFLDRPTESWRNGCCSLYTSSPVPLLRCVPGNSKCAASNSWSLILMLLVSNYSLHSHRLITIIFFSIRTELGNYKWWTFRKCQTV